MTRFLVLVLVATACVSKGPSVSPDASVQADAATDATSPADGSHLDLRPCSTWMGDLTAKPGWSCSVQMPSGAMATMGSTCAADASHVGYTSCDDVYIDVFGRKGVLVADSGECAFVQCVYGP